MIGARADASDRDMFTIRGLRPGEYVLAPSPLLVGQGIAIRSITCDGRDLTYRAFDPSVTGALRNCLVTFTDRLATVSGSVRNGSVSTAETASERVVIFPSATEEWRAIGLTSSRFRTARPATDASFTLDHLPAGDYLLCAITEAAATTWLEADTLARLSAHASRVHVGWGDHAMQSVDLVDVSRR